MDKRVEKKQKFSVSHYNESDFQSDGLRPHLQYRDLGITAATNGAFVATVNRTLFTGAKAGWHRHDVDFHMVYVLKGWVKMGFDGEGDHTFRAGSCWLQPPNINHLVYDYSEDLEVMEIISPADFATVDMPPADTTKRSSSAEPSA